MGDGERRWGGGERRWETVRGGGEKAGEGGRSTHLEDEIEGEGAEEIYEERAEEVVPADGWLVLYENLPSAEREDM